MRLAFWTSVSLLPLQKKAIVSAVKRAENVYDFTAIMDGFYKVLRQENYENDGKNTLTNRFLKMVKEYVQTDPRYQLRMDEFKGD